MTEHRIFANLDERSGLTYELACIDHDYKECAEADWFNWDTAGAMDGYEGPKTQLKNGAQVVISEASEDGFAWYYA